jgi:large subunit ribosomal protein L37Ae
LGKIVYRVIKGLGAKYGATVRKRYARVVTLLKMKRRCPKCGSWQIRRKASGIWICKTCGYQIAGEAYDVKLT